MPSISRVLFGLVRISDHTGYHPGDIAAIKASGLSYEEETASFRKISCFL